MSRKAPVWSPEEDQVLFKLIKEHKGESISSIAARASGILPNRTKSGATNRMRFDANILKAYHDENPAAATKEKQPEIQGEIHTVPTVSVSGDCERSVGIKLPKLPFAIDRSPRDESRPYDRRTSFGIKPPRQETRAELFLRILREETNHA